MKQFQLSAWLVLLTIGWMCSRGQAEETPAIVTDDRVNVRAQSSLVGEVITQVNKGETVIILQEITNENPKPQEPAKWAKIRMPANTPVWISAAYVDPATKAITASRLNLRAGPGENYSVIGRVERGDKVKEIRTVDGWMEIEPPDTAFAFVAAEFLSKSKPDPAKTNEVAAQPSTPAQQTPDTATPPVGTPPVGTPPEVAQTETPATPSNPETGAPADAVPENPTTTTTINPPPAFPLDDLPALPVPVPVPSDSSPVEPEIRPEPDPEEGAPVPLDPSPKRIVTREGIVRTAISIKAPTWFELVSTDSRKVINYLYSDDATMNLKDYKGRKIVVTGEEGVDPRWPNTPVLLIDKLNIAP